MCNKDDYFGFPHGRFVNNDKHEQRQRCVQYDIEELGRIAARAVGSNSCCSARRLPDGMYNKVLLMTMDDAKKAVAKLPYPSAGPAGLITASEVATMEFVRSKLDTPVPRVLAWNADKENSKVGVEYIIMEKASGAELDSVWPNMKIQDRFAVVKQLAQYQSIWASLRIAGYGSLYFKGHAPRCSSTPLRYRGGDGGEQTSSDFELGPSVGREWFDDGREGVEFARGPWTTLLDYHGAIGRHEKTCLNELDHLPRSSISLQGPNLYMPDRREKLKAINVYLSIFTHVLTWDTDISAGCLWYSDLHGGNIFVDPKNPTIITGLIDWQGAEITPLYYQAQQPCLIDYAGPEIHGLERPVLPTEFSTMTKDEQYQARQLWLNQSLCALYRKLVLLLAGNLLVDGEAAYLAQAVELYGKWSDVATDSSVCPLSVSKDEEEKIYAAYEAWSRAMQVMADVRKVIPEIYPGKGLVRHEDYESTIEALNEMRDKVINEYATSVDERTRWRSKWPFEQRAT
ncbi:Phosphotransferase enzyme-like protein 1 [Elsinoe fawcettii]|nr:Phosphotransferase enzyme-like protein 1 [Elsinoe fawcettii]